ncbi:unnamed protein product [Rhizophagus irregularis]|nr:unnamed protein product [Rhizophagus irregularis]CAB4407257.1 unnamed protein product [Rhizophagus irregularis]
MISSGDKKSSLYGGTFESLLQLPLKCPGSQQCIQRSTPQNSEYNVIGFVGDDDVDVDVDGRDDITFDMLLNVNMDMLWKDPEEYI